MTGRPDPSWLDGLSEARRLMDDARRRRIAQHESDMTTCEAIGALGTCRDRNRGISPYDQDASS